MATATLGWILATIWIHRGRRIALRWVFAGAVAARLAALHPEPLSDDLYRYLWDGRVANAGIDPYRFAPDAPELDHLRDDEVWPRINHPRVPTIYPPAAQVVFRVVDHVAASQRGIRVAMLLADLFTLACLAALLRARGRDPALAIVHGWCPLAIWESAGGGHVDALGVAFLLAAFVILERSSPKRGWLAGAALGLSAQVKPVAVLLATAVARDPTRRTAIALGALLSLLLFVPHLPAGTAMFRGFLTYAEHWTFNDCFYSALLSIGLGPRTARVVLGALLLAVALGASRAWRDAARATAAISGAVLLLSPTVHPWYGLWLVPWLPFLPRPFRGAGIALVSLLPVSYVVASELARTGAWREPAWLWFVVWGPVLAGILLGVVRERRLAAPPHLTA